MIYAFRAITLPFANAFSGSTGRGSSFLIAPVSRKVEGEIFIWGRVAINSLKTEYEEDDLKIHREIHRDTYNSAKNCRLEIIMQPLVDSENQRVCFQILLDWYFFSYYGIILEA